jgi:hypothetical protein
MFVLYLSYIFINTNALSSEQFQMLCIGFHEKAISDVALAQTHKPGWFLSVTPTTEPIEFFAR